jgi:hypothetical protein
VFDFGAEYHATLVATEIAAHFLAFFEQLPFAQGAINEIGNWLPDVSTAHACINLFLRRMRLTVVDFISAQICAAIFIFPSRTETMAKKKFVVSIGP